MSESDRDLTFKPGFWMDETSGVLRPAVETYLYGKRMTPEHLAAMRAYLRQWMRADWRGDGVEALRATIDGITSQQALNDWMDRAQEEDIDPL